jgi:vitamin B12 transporter
VTKQVSGFTIFLALMGLFSIFPTIILAQPDEDRKFLLMYFKEEELVVESPTRGKKSLTQVAENITVVTADDIRLMNAHTVAEVLNGVTGVQVFMAGGPGSSSLASIQGSGNRHVSMFMDGIPLNNLGDNVTEIGALPVQNIEKIEIIKGPASSAWGSALGGVVNIITKSGGAERSGTLVSTSYGAKNTADLKMETHGREQRIGYYIAAGRLETDGFNAHSEFQGNTVYAKLMYDVSKNTTIGFTVGYDKLSRGTGEFPAYDLFIKNDVETLKSSLLVRSSLSNDTEAQVTFWGLNQKYDLHNYLLSTGMQSSKDHYKDSGYGSSAKLSWKYDLHNIVLGADFDSKKLESNVITGNEQGLKKLAYYLNDTMTVYRLSLTPGIRYDKTDTNGNFTSPSLGITYKITDLSLLRAYVERGFSIPPLAATFGDNVFYISNPDLKMERVWSYELGTESTALPYVWTKLSLFRHDISGGIRPKVLSPTTSTSVNGGKERRQGMEVEIKSLPIYYTSIIVGAAFMNAQDLDTGQTIRGVPQRTYDVGIQFEDNSLKAQLKGHYVYWNADPSFNGKYDSMIVDLHVAKELYAHLDQSLEVFVDVHNIFNGSQYLVDVYKNPERWVEAGVRYAF